MSVSDDSGHEPVVVVLAEIVTSDTADATTIATCVVGE